MQGVQPSPAECAATPGCMMQTNCGGSWTADTCQNYTQYGGGQEACEGATGCAWVVTTQSADSNQPYGGYCYDALLNAQCNLAGQTGGVAGCAAVVDAYGTPVCTSNPVRLGRGFWPCFHASTSAAAAAPGVGLWLGGQATAVVAVPGKQGRGALPDPSWLLFTQLTPC